MPSQQGLTKMELGKAIAAGILVLMLLEIVLLIMLDKYNSSLLESVHGMLLGGERKKTAETPTVGRSVAQIE